MIYRDLDDDREMIPVRELLDDSYFTIVGTRGFTGEEPEHGSNWFSPRIHDTRYDDDEIEVLEVPATTWGEYITCGSVERSNFNVLVDEYREHVIDAEWFHDTHAIYLRLDREIPAEMFDRLLGLADYPLLDDQEMSDVEMKLEEEDWEGYGRQDLRLAIERALDALEVPGLDDPTEFYLSDSELDTLASVARGSGDLEWECETATNGYYRGLDELAAQYVAEVVDALDRDFEAYARTLDNPLGDAQLTLV